MEKLSLVFLAAAILAAQWPPQKFVFSPTLSLTGNSGAPYSADEVHERATRDAPESLKRTEVDHLYRDSQGRLRKEIPVSHSNLRVAVIDDPVAGWMIVLDPQAKVAHRMKVARSHVYPISPPSGDWHPNGSDQLLGARTIEGFQAVGSRSIIKQDTGVSTTDLWYIRELALVVLEKTTLPRSGVFVTRIEHLKPGEPAAALFVVPPDYSVVDETGSFSFSVAP